MNSTAVDRLRRSAGRVADHGTRELCGAWFGGASLNLRARPSLPESAGQGLLS